VNRRRLIAIVDDDTAVRRAICRIITSAGLASEGFSSAEEFLSHSWDESPNCLILDLGLPGMSGLELQRLLAADHDQIPIVFITGRDNSESRDLALRAGAIAFLVKPLKEEALLGAIRSAIGASDS
jgi:FixJ family two-component response regulator